MQVVPKQRIFGSSEPLKTHVSYNHVIKLECVGDGALEVINLRLQCDLSLELLMFL